MDQIIEKLSSVLTEGDLTSIQSYLETKIDEGVALKIGTVEEQMTILAEQAEQAVSEKNKELEEAYELKFSQAVSEIEAQAKQKIDEAIAEKEQLKSKVEVVLSEAEEMAAELISEQVEAKTAELEAEYAQKFKLFETKIVSTLDTFLETEISSRISDKLLKGIAKREAFAPIVEGVLKVFDNSGIGLDRTGRRIAESYKRQMTTMKDELDYVRKNAEIQIKEAKRSADYLIKDKMQLTETLKEAKAALIFSEKTKGLSESTVAQVEKMLAEATAEEVEGRIDDVISFVLESEQRLQEATQLAEQKIIEERKSAAKALAEAKEEAKRALLEAKTAEESARQLQESMDRKAKARQQMLTRKSVIEEDTSKVDELLESTNSLTATLKQASDLVG